MTLPQASARSYRQRVAARVMKTVCGGLLAAAGDGDAQFEFAVPRPVCLRRAEASLGSARKSV
jgi:hypothetical protein